MTVTVRMIGQEKTFVRTKEICDCDSENDWTSTTVVRTKGIGDCDSENMWTSKWVDKENFCKNERDR